MKSAKATSPVAQYYQAHHERSASMVGEIVASPCGLEVPAGAKSSRSKSFDAASAARTAASGSIPVQESQATSASSGVIGASTTSGPTSGGKRRVRGSGGFLEIPKWKMLIRRSSVAVGGGASSGGGSSGASGGSSGQGGCGSTFTIDETTGLYWRDCIHCLLLIEMLKISPPVSCKSSVSSEGSQESEPTSTVAPITTAVTFSVVGSAAITGRNRSASCQSTLLEGVDTSLMVHQVESSSGSCFMDESEEMKMIESQAAAIRTIGEGTGSNVNSGSPSPIPLVTLSFAPDDEFQMERRSWKWCYSHFS